MGIWGQGKDWRELSGASSLRQGILYRPKGSWDMGSVNKVTGWQSVDSAFFREP